jgi:hypothetical protein
VQPARPGALVLGLLVSALVMLGAARPPVAVGVEPSPSPIVGGPVDPRSEGEGPGLEGEPLIILAAVVLLGAAAAAGTVVYSRLTRDD